MSNELATKEGIFVGITSGATFAGALRVCAEAPKGSTILAMLPDTGERYLEHAAVCQHPRRHDAGGGRDLQIDARRPVRRLTSAGPEPVRLGIRHPVQAPS